MRSFSKTQPRTQWVSSHGLWKFRLSDDWEAAHGHPLELAETFVDPERFRGTCYAASNWVRVGRTKGFARHNGSYTDPHAAPKEMFVRALRADARERLSDPADRPEWTCRATPVKYARGVARAARRVRGVAGLPPRAGPQAPPGDGAVDLRAGAAGGAVGAGGGGAIRGGFAPGRTARAGCMAQRRGPLAGAVVGDHLPGDGEHRPGRAGGGVARVGGAAAGGGRRATRGRVRIRGVNRAADMQTPYEKLRSPPHAEARLKPGVSFAQLDAQAHAHSDLPAGRSLNAERDRLFRGIAEAQPEVA